MTRGMFVARSYVLLFALLSIAVSCSSTTLKPAGTACAADSDCAAGLSCLGLVAVSSDGGCTTAAKACSKVCTLDADCAPLGANFLCFGGCGGTRSCGATQ
jgi:hypothetical protein